MTYIIPNYKYKYHKCITKIITRINIVQCYFQKPLKYYLLKLLSETK